MEFFDRLHSVSERWNVLRHPFYVRWSEGTLSRRDLALYADEYRHLVLALAETAGRAAGPDHAAEEASHVALWDDFAAAVGARGGGPLPETAGCVESWTPATELEAVTVLYAVESAQPEISRVKLDGLLEHYGLDEGPATAYFALHSDLDHEHARLSRARLVEELPTADADRLVAAAETALHGNWRMLDGVERALAA